MSPLRDPPPPLRYRVSDFRYGDLLPPGGGNLPDDGEMLLAYLLDDWGPFMTYCRPCDGCDLFGGPHSHWPSSFPLALIGLLRDRAEMGKRATVD